jgi:hypothetical protein
MKWLYTILIILFSLTGFTQNDSNLTCFTDTEVLNISNKIKTKDDSIRVLLDIVNAQAIVIKQQDETLSTDSLIIVGFESERNLYKYEIDLYKDLYKTTKMKWYQKPGFTFSIGAIVGAGVMYGAQSLP